MRLPKKYIKKYGGINKKAWRAFKNRTLSGTTRKKRKVTVMKRRKRRAAPKKRRRVVTASVRMGARKKTARRRRVTIMSNRYMNALINSGAVGVGAIGSTIAMNKLPFVNTLTPWQKALIQVGIGVFGIPFVKNPMLKKVVGGATVGGAISLLIPFMPEGFSFYAGGPVLPVATSGRPFTPSELTEMTAMGIPINTPGYKSNNMGAILNLNTMGNRGSRSYAKAY